MEESETQTVIVLENDVAFAANLAKTIESNSSFKVKVIHNFIELRILLSSTETFFAAVADIHLPDCPEEEVIDYLLDNEIPTIILTGSFNEGTKDIFLEKPIVDYVLKENKHEIDYIVTQLKRLEVNHNAQVLVVDDSIVVREVLKKYLHCHRYQVLEASDGQEGYDIIMQNPGIKLVISDYDMPNMTGYELVQKIRETFSKTQLPIMGISSSSKPVIAAEFLKKGANDFLYKPFHKEEFFCRINQNLDILDYIEQIQQAAYTDYLTQLPNRKYFFEKGRQLYAQLKEQNKAFVLCMLDIDLFKRINDFHGHDVGDQVLIRVAQLIKEKVRRNDIVARLGGEEFGILFNEIDVKSSLELMESIRKQVEQAQLVLLPGGVIKATISLGATHKSLESLDEMLHVADKNLYTAKKKGRNQLVMT